MKALIIGFGSIGKRHYEILSSILGLDNVYIVTRRISNIKNNFKTLSQVENLDDFQYFIVASKTFEHFSDLSYINSKVNNKNILVEKPLFEAERINTIIPKNNIFIGYNLRFHPLIELCRERINNRKIFNASFYAGQYLPTWRPNTDYKKSYSAKKEEGGGILLDYSHDIDLLNYLLGRVENLEAYNNKISDLDISSDDYFSMIGLTEKNIHFILSLDSISQIQRREIRINLQGETIEIDLINNIFTSKKYHEEPQTIKLNEYNRNFSFEKMHKSILSNNDNINLVATFENGLYLNSLFQKIKKNSHDKGWK